MRLWKLNFSRSFWRRHGLKRRLVEWLSIAAMVALIAVPIGILGWLLFFTDTFTVRAVTVVDAREHTAAQVRDIADELVGENMLFAQTPRLEQRILNEIPQIRDVHIVRKLPATLKVTVQEKIPALLLLSKGKYYFVDRQGVAYEIAQLHTLPGTLLPIVKNNDEQAEVELGRPVVGASFVEFLSQAQSALPDIVGAEVAEIRIPSLAAREVHFLLDANWLIRFDITRGLGGQLDVLQRLLKNNIAEEDLPRLEYVDLRIANRVYYKVRPGL